MFHKIIKRGHRKGSKADDSAFGYAPSGGRGSGVVSTSYVVVNYASRVGPIASGRPNSAPSSGGAGAIIASAATPTGTIEALPKFKDVPVSVRQNLFIRKLQFCCYQFDFSDSLKPVREKEMKMQTLLELVDFFQSGSGNIHECVQEEMIRMVTLSYDVCLLPVRILVLRFLSQKRRSRISSLHGLICKLYVCCC